MTQSLFDIWKFLDLSRHRCISWLHKPFLIRTINKCPNFLNHHTFIFHLNGVYGYFHSNVASCSVIVPNDGTILIKIFNKTILIAFMTCTFAATTVARNPLKQISIHGCKLVNLLYLLVRFVEKCRQNNDRFGYLLNISVSSLVYIVIGAIATCCHKNYKSGY